MKIKTRKTVTEIIEEDVDVELPLFYYDDWGGDYNECEIFSMVKLQNGKLLEFVLWRKYDADGTISWELSIDPEYYVPEKYLESNASAETRYKEAFNDFCHMVNEQ